MSIVIPGEVKIGGFTYKVRFDERAVKELRASGVKGWCDKYNREIAIDPVFDSQETSNTFLHEAIHAVLEVYHGEQIDDLVVIQLSNGLHQILNDLGIIFVKEEQVPEKVTVVTQSTT